MANGLDATPEEVRAKLAELDAWKEEQLLAADNARLQVRAKIHTHYRGEAKRWKLLLKAAEERAKRPGTAKPEPASETGEE